jgi:hypothetical protein
MGFWQMQLQLAGKHPRLTGKSFRSFPNGPPIPSEAPWKISLFSKARKSDS